MLVSAQDIFSKDSECIQDEAQVGPGRMWCKMHDVSDGMADPRAECLPTRNALYY